MDNLKTDSVFFLLRAHRQRNMKAVHAYQAKVSFSQDGHKSEFGSWEFPRCKFRVLGFY